MNDFFDELEKNNVDTSKNIKNDYSAQTAINTNYETEKNINTLNLLSKILKWLMLIFGAIACLVAFTIAEEAGILCFIIGIVTIIFAFILPAFIKWKALMLKHLYEINIKNIK